ncbi:two-component system sensor histidine kinase DesK [Glaciihabitans tibetensis]|uniref:Two-component system sensor histidine kinase DesK n=2 Tax=Glaciihabitans tibetensis TaxID=1266600 RepID=A0A2T0VHD1_9MICO|nr:two-component system sensor histidine kinase DesK [Glaciihabitans tibetensis]
MAFVAVGYALIALSQVTHEWLIVGVIAATIPVTALVCFWERRAPIWLAILATALSSVVWWATVALQELGVTSLLLGMAVGVLLTQTAKVNPFLLLAGLGFVVAPVGIAALVRPEQDWTAYLLTASVAYAVAVGLFLLNRYTWNRYLEIDAARRTGAELAVAQERYRFAADLHDIQGHTLHVLRLKTQLADKLIDRDPAAAHAHLAEAQALISETLANTRSLAFGERHLVVATELANAQELFAAAGIRCTVEGSMPATPNDELFALVVREATTNILRHAQAQEVTVRLGEGSLVITNDGSPEPPRPRSGLARLAERFIAAGGTLQSGSASGVFTTAATIS